jgi:type IV pilus assembly protein PilC
MLYEYLALQKDQTKVKGVVDAPSEKDLTEFLKKNGLFPIEVKEKKSSEINDAFSGIFNRISFQDIVLITRQFAIMLDAGLTLIASIEIIIKQTTKPALKKMLQEIEHSLRNGKTLSNTLESFPKFFSNFYISLVKSGEASGKLDVILNKLSLHLENERLFQQTVRNALMYPIAVISAMLVMIFAMFTFVMPQILKLYDSFEVELPATTLAIKNISNFMNMFWPIIVGVLGVIILSAVRFKKSSKGKEMFDRISLRLPLFGKIVKISGLVDVTRTLSILISSGVPILDSLKIVTNVNSNIVFKRAFINIKDKVEKGMSIGTAMQNEDIFPESLIQMTIVGEQTGSLDLTLKKISDYYQSESELAVKGLLTLMEPAILVVLGIVVGFLVVSVITPIFSLTTSLQ